MALMDKVGRKVLLLWSFFGMAMAMAVQVVAASSYSSGSGSLYLSVGGMLMFVLTFALGAGPVPGLLLPKIFPGRIRAKAMAVQVVALGDKFLCGFAILATTRKSWPTASVFYVWYRLHDGCGFCETECGGN